MYEISVRCRKALCTLLLVPSLATSSLAGARDSAMAPAVSTVASATAATPTPSIPIIPPGSAYRQTNLISDVAGIASLQDPLLVNPWGIALSGSSPFWVADNGLSLSTVYREDPAGDTVIINPSPSSVTIPGGLPTGTVFNGTSDFVITSGASAPASFLYASITGNIVGWNTAVPSGGSTTGVIAASHPGRVYTGLASGNNGGANLLYAADFANGNIDVYDATFALTAVGGFVDPTIPTVAGNTYHPHNIQNIGGSLYVTYAKVGVTGFPENGVGNGFVRRFNTNGIRDLTFGINNGALDAPWGMAIAPASFGIFGGALLVGNFSDAGKIHAYNPTTGAFLGTLQDESGNAIGIDQLWGLQFGNGAAAGDLGALYFTAGIGQEEHGLFGSLRPTTATAQALVQFSATDYSANETSGTINITIVRAGDTTGAASVNYAALPVSQVGSAGAADFTLAPGSVSFAAGQTSGTFAIAITNDALVEGNETVTLVLSNPAGAGLATPSIATLTIVDNGTGGSADVSIVKTAPATVVPGTTFTYTLTVTNSGPDAATNVTTSDTLPAGTTFVSATPSQGSCSGTTTVTCTLGTLSPVGSATIALNVMAPVAGGPFSNTASVTATELDPNAANNSSTVSVNGVFPPVGPPLPVPALSFWVLLALGAMLAGIGITFGREQLLQR